MHTDRTQVVNAPTNTSTAKALYSFKKAKRFIEKIDSTGKFYDIPSAFDKRSTSFGYGKKYDFTGGKDKTPGPGSYKSLQEKPLNGGFSFGLSRENCKGFVKGAFNADPNIPGPGSYSFTPKFSNEGRKISLTGKAKDLKSKDLVPGPGTYNQNVSTSPGKYVVSNIKNLEVYSFSPKTTRALTKDKKCEMPAPGAYDVDKGFLNYGKVLSTCKSSGSIKFGFTEREFNYGIKNTPGPGSYKLPSEFGYYETPQKTSTASASSLINKRPNK